jgi:excisionase family DNA binding protein
LEGFANPNEIIGGRPTYSAVDSGKVLPPKASYFRSHCDRISGPKSSSRPEALKCEHLCMNDAEDLLTAKEAAWLLRVDERTVTRWFKSGQLPGFKIGSKMWRISRAALGRHIAVGVAGYRAAGLQRADRP